MMKGVCVAAVFVVLLLAILSSGCTGGESGPEVNASFDEEYRANEKTIVSVENPSGQVTITRGDVRDVVLHAVTRSRVGEEELEKVEITATRGDFLKIRTRWLSALPPRVTVDMNITVPRYVTVDAVTASNGDVRISGTRGDVAVSCFNGDVVISDVDGDVTAAVENGNIEVRGTEGIADLKAKNGRVEAEVRDVSGDVTIESTNGGIVLALDPALDALLAVTTTNGVISVEGLPLEVTTETQTTVDGVLGNGGPMIEIDCSNGDVNISAL